MNDTASPLIIEPDALEARLGEPDLVVVDVGKPETYAQLHVPGAVHLDVGVLMTGQPPVMGLLPPLDALAQQLGALGIGDDSYVVAYDDEGGPRAARLLWTLDVLGHTRHGLLNGGLHAWANEGHPTTAEPGRPTPRTLTLRRSDAPLAERDYVAAHLDDDAVVVLDARSPEEYRGMKVMAARGGHIPGAVNVDWTETLDQGRNLRLKPAEAVRALYEGRGITPDKTIVTHCQTHYRSAHSYIALKWLGYAQVKGYPGSWSDWGNAPDTPVATD
ncbi:sulfurtransferase [Ectothiorhodospiraceae bacterium 2226]|nr:sulfurtransferase [Ectothiorhodospiraceae bacterium 2226]